MKSLNDFLPAGSAEVWYMRPEWFPNGIMGEKPDFHNLNKTHILLGTVDGSCGEESLWASLQAENWSPNGEARLLIKSKGLQHTSMSVGDLFRFDMGRIALCDVVGFQIFQENQ